MTTRPIAADPPRPDGARRLEDLAGPIHDRRRQPASRRSCRGKPARGAPTLMTQLDRADDATADDATAEFEAFYRDRVTEARRYAATILAQRAPADLDDTLQDAWTRAWRAWHQADPDRRDAWFFRIVRNCCLDVHRRHRPTEPLDELHLPAVDNVEPVVSRIDARRTAALLERLKAPLREALWLREAVGLSYAEIAEVQGVPEGTVMSRLHTARKRMARLLRRNT